MNRPHPNLLRGLSSDERMKTKTKKSKICQERRELNPLKTNEGPEGRNMDILLNIANSMKLLADRHSEQRFKAIDVKVIELIVTELTLTRRMEEYERDQNRAKIREMKSLIEKVVAKKNEVIAESERINLLIRSGSPKNRKGIIAYEMSPPLFNNPVGGLIERKIEEDNRERVTFQAMKKKDQRLARLFDFVDRMAEKLNICDENSSLKGRINKISELVEGFASSEQEYKCKLIEQSQCNSKLKQEVQALSSQNTLLKSSVDSLTAELESCKHQVSLKNRLYSQLQQDFNLLAKEKLDAQTTFSKVLSQSERLKDKYQRTINNLKVRFSELLKEEVDELKNSQTMLSKQVEEYTLLHCQSVNTIIYHYTKEMMALNAKKAELKKQVGELQRERSAKEERGRDLERLKMELKKNVEKERMKRQRLVLGHCFYEEFQGEKRVNKCRFAFEFSGAFTYFPAAKINQCSQTYIKANALSSSPIVSMTIKAKTQYISLESNVFKLAFFPSCKESLELQTQTEPQPFPFNQSTTIDTQEFSLQTTLEHSSREIQASPSFNDTSTSTLPHNLAIGLAFSLLTSFPQIKDKASTETEHLFLHLNEGFSFAIFPTKIQTFQADTNTNTDLLSSFSQPQPIQPSTPTPNKKRLQPNNDPFLSFLLQAQQCTIIPEIFLLRQQLRLHRLQIDSLRSQLSSKPKQTEDPTVFQFHY